MEETANREPESMGQHPNGMEMTEEQFASLDTGDAVAAIEDINEAETVVMKNGIRVYKGIPGALTMDELEKSGRYRTKVGTDVGTEEPEGDDRWFWQRANDWMQAQVDDFITESVKSPEQKQREKDAADKAVMLAERKRLEAEERKREEYEQMVEGVVEGYKSGKEQGLF